MDKKIFLKRPYLLETNGKLIQGIELYTKFCQLDPNTINVEDETLRVKVMVAIHAARAYEVGPLIVKTNKICSAVNFITFIRARFTYKHHFDSFFHVHVTYM